MKKAFSLVELLIVVAILGILAAVVIPEVSSHVMKAKESAAKDTLRILRESIERYYAENGVAPGYVGRDPTASASSGQFLLNVVYRSDYINSPPENPFNDKSNLYVIQNGADMPAGATGTYGWIYKPQTRTIRLDWPGTDSKGVSYYSY